jgi:hypothetical protein
MASIFILQPSTPSLKRGIGGVINFLFTKNTPGDQNVWRSLRSLFLQSRQGYAEGIAISPHESVVLQIWDL